MPTRLGCNWMLPVPPSRSSAKHCHNRLAHTVAMLMVHEYPGALVECLFLTMCVCVFVCMCVCVCVLFVSETIMCNEWVLYSELLLTGHTEQNAVVTQLSYRLPTTYTRSACQERAECVPVEGIFVPADGKPQQWSLWWPAFPLISWLMYREKPGPLESHWNPARVPNLPPHQSYVMFWWVQ